MDQSTERISPPRKWKQANLLRYPSASVISAHKRMKRKTNSDNNGTINDSLKASSDNENKNRINSDNNASEGTKSDKQPSDTAAVVTKLLIVITLSLNRITVQMNVQ